MDVSNLVGCIDLEWVLVRADWLCRSVHGRGVSSAVGTVVLALWKRHGWSRMVAELVAKARDCNVLVRSCGSVSLTRA